MSRCAAAAAQLLDLHRGKYPFKLFAALDGEPEKIFSDSSCLHDELTQRLLTKYDTPAKLLAGEGREVLRSLASLVPVDISQIESTHAMARRSCKLLSVQTHVPRLTVLNAHFLLRQAAVRRQQWFRRQFGRRLGLAANAKTRARAAQQKQRRGGGAWRAFLRQAVRGGARTRFQYMPRLAREYQALLQSADPDDRGRLQLLLEAGAAATRASQAGFRAFGHRLPFQRQGRLHVRRGTALQGQLTGLQRGLRQAKEAAASEVGAHNFVSASCSL